MAWPPGAVLGGRYRVLRLIDGEFVYFLWSATTHFLGGAATPGGRPRGHQGPPRTGRSALHPGAAPTPNERWRPGLPSWRGASQGGGCGRSPEPAPTPIARRHTRRLPCGPEKSFSYGAGSGAFVFGCGSSRPPPLSTRTHHTASASSTVLAAADTRSEAGDLVALKVRGGFAFSWNLLEGRGPCATARPGWAAAGGPRGGLFLPLPLRLTRLHTSTHPPDRPGRRGRPRGGGGRRARRGEWW
jgi:hypothetical protein